MIDTLLDPRCRPEVFRFPHRVGHRLRRFARHSGDLYARPGVDVRALFPGDIEIAQGAMLVTQYGKDLQSQIVKVPHHGSGDVFIGFPDLVAADLAFVSSSGTNRTFAHPRRATLDLFAATAEIFCTCDADEEDLTFTVVGDEQGGIDVTPDQPPHFAWAPNSRGNLQRVTVTP